MDLLVTVLKGSMSSVFFFLYPWPHTLPRPSFEMWKPRGSRGQESLRSRGLESWADGWKCSAGLWWVGIGADGSCEPLFLQLNDTKTKEWASPLDLHSSPFLIVYKLFSVRCCFESQEIGTRTVIKHLLRRFWELVSQASFTWNGMLNNLVLKWRPIPEELLLVDLRNECENKSLMFQMCFGYF